MIKRACEAIRLQLAAVEPFSASSRFLFALSSRSVPFRLLLVLCRRIFAVEDRLRHCLRKSWWGNCWLEIWVKHQDLIGWVKEGARSGAILEFTAIESVLTTSRLLLLLLTGDRSCLCCAVVTAVVICDFFRRVKVAACGWALLEDSTIEAVVASLRLFVFLLSAIRR